MANHAQEAMELAAARLQATAGWQNYDRSTWQQWIPAISVEGPLAHQYTKTFRDKFRAILGWGIGEEDYSIDWTGAQLASDQAWNAQMLDADSPGGVTNVITYSSVPIPPPLTAEQIAQASSDAAWAQTMADAYVPAPAPAFYPPPPTEAELQAQQQAAADAAWLYQMMDAGSGAG